MYRDLTTPHPFAMRQTAKCTAVGRVCCTDYVGQQPTHSNVQNSLPGMCLPLVFSSPLQRMLVVDEVIVCYTPMLRLQGICCWSATASVCMVVLWLLQELIWTPSRCCLPYHLKCHCQQGWMSCPICCANACIGIVKAALSEAYTRPAVCQHQLIGLRCFPSI